MYKSLTVDPRYDIPLIILTGFASIEHAMTAIKAGAVDYITKPVDARQLEIAVEQALGVQRLRRENAALRLLEQVLSSIERDLVSLGAKWCQG